MKLKKIIIFAKSGLTFFNKKYVINGEDTPLASGIFQTIWSFLKEEEKNNVIELTDDITIETTNNNIIKIKKFDNSFFIACYFTLDNSMEKKKSNKILRTIADRFDEKFHKLIIEWNHNKQIFDSFDTDLQQILNSSGC